MREIKFRAWDNDLLRFSKRATEYPIKDIEYLTDYAWEQYTGLKDKNGIEIYEGDIIKAFHHEYKETWLRPAMFENGTYTLGRYWKDGIHDWHSMEQFDSFELEVIGNIHENPELLK